MNINDILKPKSDEEIIKDLDLKEDLKKFLIANGYSLLCFGIDEQRSIKFNNTEVFYFRNEKRTLSVTKGESLEDLKQHFKV